MTEETFHLTVNCRDGVTVVAFADRKILDEFCINEIRDELSKLVVGSPGVKLLLDFSAVEHMSSAALGALITLDKQVAEEKGTLKLSDISPQIYEVFKITRLNKLFDIHETTALAIKSF